MNSSNFLKFPETPLERSDRKIISDKLSIIIPPTDTESECFADDVKIGLTHSPKYLLPKYFYDTRGSELFEKITTLKEYYLTGIERSIILNISNILPQIDKNISTLVEIGSGSADKTRHIIKAYSAARDKVQYIPIDISDIIIDSSKNLITGYNNVFIDAIISNYDMGLEIVQELGQDYKLYLFLGSSIGNFTFHESINFLSNLNSMMDANDKLLIGFDRIKKRETLCAAYDDNQGVTAKFNMNLLHRINTELDADFDLHEFEHEVLFNETKNRIEMHLVSKKLQYVMIRNLDLKIHFQAGESIHTENSYKYTKQMIQKIAKESGFEIIDNFSDERNYYSLCLFQPNH